jgi:hypothetical protein
VRLDCKIEKKFTSRVKGERRDSLIRDLFWWCSNQILCYYEVTFLTLKMFIRNYTNLWTDYNIFQKDKSQKQG